MNYMDKICDLLDLKFFEKFKIIEKSTNLKNSTFKNIKNPYYFTEKGMINKYGNLDNFLLGDLISGCFDIEKINYDKIIN